MKRLIFLLFTLCILFSTALASDPPVLVEPEFLTPYLPQHTLIRGVSENGRLYLLMRNPSGETVFIGSTQSESGEWSFFESAPLPEGAILGDENFSTALSIPTDEYPIRVTLSPFWDGEWGVTELSYQGGEPIRLGRTWISLSGPFDGVFGDHPWSNISSIDWSSLPTSYEEAASQINDSWWFIISLPEKQYSTYLYLKPSLNAPVLEKYPPVPNPSIDPAVYHKTIDPRLKFLSGTPVRLQKLQDQWALVTVCDNTGWIPVEYLVPGEFISEVSVKLTPVIVDRGDTTLYAERECTTPLFTVPYGTKAFVLNSTTRLYTLWFPDTDAYGIISPNTLSAIPGDG